MEVLVLRNTKKPKMASSNSSPSTNTPRTPSPEPASRFLAGGGTRSPNYPEQAVVPDGWPASRPCLPHEISLQDLSKEEIAAGTWTVRQMYDYLWYLRDFCNQKESEPSICIPRVFSNITEARVRAIFNRLGFGELQQIDMVARENDRGETFNRVFVHFKSWNTDNTDNTDFDGTNEAELINAFIERNEDTIRARFDLIIGKQVKLVYDDPWFWKMSASRSVRPEERLRKQRSRPKPRLDWNGN